MKIDKVLSLPQTLDSDTLYLVGDLSSDPEPILNGYHCEVSDSTGSSTINVSANRSIRIKGDKNIILGQTKTYVITNFDSFTIYEVVPISGSVIVNGETITYTAPSTIQSSGFIINNEIISLDLLPLPLIPPVIIHDSFNELVKTNLLNHMTNTGQSWAEGFWGLNSNNPDTGKLEVNTDGTASVLEYSNGDISGTDTPYASAYNTISELWVNHEIPVYNYYIEAIVDVLSDCNDSYIGLIGRIQQAPGPGGSTNHFVDINWWPSPSWNSGKSEVNSSSYGTGHLSSDITELSSSFTAGQYLLRVEFIFDECKFYIDGVLKATYMIDTTIITPNAGSYVGFRISQKTTNSDSPGIKILDFKVNQVLVE